jgi:PKD repeat protein
MKKYIFLSIFTVIFGYQVLSQSYCTPSFTGTPAASPFYTHILNFSFGEINQSYLAYYYAYGYYNFYTDFTYVSTNLVPGYTYPLRITVGNGANTQTLSVWIDFNNNKTFETSERVYTKIDTANKGDHLMRANITIPSNTPLGQTRMRVGTIIGITAPGPCVNNTYNSQQFQDYTVNFVAPAVQTYTSTAAYQTVNEEVTKGSINNQILEIRVTTNSDGTQSPLKLDTIYFSTLGTTNPAEITRAKLYYTGKSPEFQTTTLLASTTGTPTANFKIRANQNLAPGTNYFWLTYDVASNAVIGNDLDARCNGVYIRVKRIPSILDPSGTRKVGYAISVGNKTWFVYISNVILGKINNNSGYNLTYGYNNFLNQSDTLMKKKFHTIYVTTGNGVNSNTNQAWIDYNKDGVFDPINERVLFDSIIVPQTTPPTYIYGPVSDSFNVPLNSPVGPTRLRVTTNFNATGRVPAKPNENPVEVGEVEDYTVILGDNGQSVAKFSAPVTCFGNPTPFYDQSYTFGNYTVNKWVWNFGDGDTSHQQNPQHTYKNPGVYNVTLQVNTNFTGNITGTVTQAVKVNKPVADFFYSGHLFQSAIQFNDETSGGLTNLWDWNFGDPQSGWNNISSAKSPTHYFDTIGKYDITLIVTTEGGCSDTIVKRIVIDSNITPVADFSASTFNPYYNQVVTLQDLSVYNPTTWKWSFSPGSISYVNGTNPATRNPQVTFNSVGTFTIKLVASNSAGSDSITKTITTKNYVQPVADFTADPTTVKAGQMVSFLDMSTNDPTSWLWYFGDKDSSLTQHPIHIYQNTGNYSIGLTVTNPAGSSNKVRGNYIKVTNEYELCDNDAPSSSLFSGLLYDDGGKTNNYRANRSCGFLIKPECSGPITLRFYSFNFDTLDYVRVYDGENEKGIPLFTGNGFTGSSSPQNCIAYSGAMYVEEITNGDLIGGTGFEAFWSATPNIAPVPEITADTIGYVHGQVTVTNGTSLGTGNSYYWDYNSDGKMDDTNNTTGILKYDSNGYYTITLWAENCKGKSSTTHTIHIISPTSEPVADFISDKDTVVEFEKVHFFDKSTMGPTGWLWEIKYLPDTNMYPPPYFFDDGTSEYSQNPVIEFFSEGAYDITLTSTNNLGASQPETKHRFIYLKPKGQMCLFPYSSSSPAGRLFDDGGELYNYDNNKNCGFLINPCANKVVLKFKSFAFEVGDYLRVYDGTDNTGKPFHTGQGYTINQIPPTYLVAETGAMYIEEVTGWSGTAPGFVADWSIIPISVPKAKFECFDTVYTGGYVTRFENKSTGTITGNFWDYNFDGIVDDSSTDGSYKFSSPGKKNIQLTSANCAGSTRFTKNVTVIDPTRAPLTDFIANKVNADTSDAITFKDQTKYGPNHWKWEFNPSTVQLVNKTDTNSAWPFVKFTIPGKYDVTLVTRNAFGFDSMVKKQYINIFSYCRPIVTYLEPNFGISKVIFNSINNTSPCGATAYTDYTSTISTTIEVGGTYNFRISTITPNSYSRKIWIDYNQDGIFNDTNELAASLTNSNLLTWAGTLKVSPLAKMGQTRMRIGVDVASGNNKPCGPNFNGEFEDYRLFITNDLTPPVITLKGSYPTYTEIGFPYIDSGAIAIDAVDGDISSKIKVVQNVNITKSGINWVTYNVTDAAGNVATEVKRKVYVTPDKTPPIISLKGKNPYSMSVFSKYIEQGATALDNIDGNISNLIVIQNNVDTSRVDTFKVFYSAYDKTGNFSPQIERTVYVVDTTAPVIKLIGTDTIFHDKGIKYTDSGATVTDNYYPRNQIQLIPSNNVDIVHDGWYWYHYDAIDASGNYAVQKTRVVKVGHPEGIKDNNSNIRTEVYPNPSSGQFTLSLELNRKFDVSLDVIDPLGKTIEHSVLYGIMKKDVKIDLGKQAQGVYLLRIKAGNNTVYKRVTILN